MADEIKIYTDSGLVIYALIRQASNMFIWDVGDTAFELQGVWSDTRLDECDLPLSEGLYAYGWYMTDFPASIPAGFYHLQFFRRLGSLPSVANDIFYGGYDMWWDGQAEVDALIQDKAAKIRANNASQDKLTGTITIRNSDDSADLLQMALTDSGSTITRATTEI